MEVKNHQVFRSFELNTESKEIQKTKVMSQYVRLAIKTWMLWKKLFFQRIL